MKSITKYLEPCEGDWNNPSIRLESVNYNSNGLAPIFRGGCMGIIPYNEKFIILAEDDDNYWETITFTKEELLIYSAVLKRLSEEVTVKIDFVKAKSESKYTRGEKVFFNTNFSSDMFKVTITNRGKKTSPLVTISYNNWIQTFDIYWAKRRYEVCKKVLNNKK